MNNYTKVYIFLIKIVIIHNKFLLFRITLSSLKDKLLLKKNLKIQRWAVFILIYYYYFFRFTLMNSYLFLATQHYIKNKKLFSFLVHPSIRRITNDS